MLSSYEHKITGSFSLRSFSAGNLHHNNYLKVQFTCVLNDLKINMHKNHTTMKSVREVPI